MWAGLNLSMSETEDFILTPIIVPCTHVCSLLVCYRMSLCSDGSNRVKNYHDKSGIRTHASCETRKLLLVVESRYTLTWRLRPTRPSYQRR
ncbi:hypothetical protein VN97_g2515 [Penicillium thymicola]|uniref:Uncharacterized protein n=1 Tax=Penicillium thymicola TaxID=293382 RepID=A0AAI9TPD3_PENTH|nr:hypothetical protein VN97_g2515 [Penicillium thymicola]